MLWQVFTISPTVGGYEYQYDGARYTGWCRWIGGQLADGTWPMWHSRTGEQRDSLTGRVLEPARQ